MADPDDKALKKKAESAKKDADNLDKEVATAAKDVSLAAGKYTGALVEEILKKIAKALGYGN